jgi:hypothetical protein
MSYFSYACIAQSRRRLLAGFRPRWRAIVHLILLLDTRSRERCRLRKPLALRAYHVGG